MSRNVTEKPALGISAHSQVLNTVPDEYMLKTLD